MDLAGGDPDKWRILGPLVHHRTAVVAGWLVTLLAYLLWPRQILPTLALLVAIVAYLVATFAEVRHFGLLCVRCMARFPVDGARQAQRKRPWLRCQHFLVVPLSLLGLAAAAAAMLLSAPALLIVTVGETLVVVYSVHTHRLLQFWCPWCGDDGPSVAEPDPLPQERARR
jgi:hypothetical protein